MLNVDGGNLSNSQTVFFGFSSSSSSTLGAGY
jgi:hypothetical protein